VLHFFRSEKRRRHALRALVLIILGAAAFHAVIYLATAHWIVYGNDYVHFNATLTALPVIAIAAFVFTRSRFVAVALFLLLIPIFYFYRDRIIVERLKNATVSCANHSSFTGKMFSASELPTVLTNSIEFADYLEQLYAGQTLRPNMLCPGWKWSKTKTGVAYVGAGLDHKKLPAEDILIAFCFADSHPIPFDHHHCIFFEANRSFTDTNDWIIGRTCVDTREMTNRLTAALQQAREGKVPYTPAAQELLARELSRRIETLTNPPLPHALTNLGPKRKIQ
jgi:hypothetical protein